MKDEKEREESVGEESVGEEMRFVRPALNLAKVSLLPHFSSHRGGNSAYMLSHSQIRVLD